MRRIAHIIIALFLIALIARLALASEIVLSKKEVAQGSFFAVTITDAPPGSSLIRFQKKSFRTFEIRKKTQFALIPVGFGDPPGKAELTAENDFQVFLPKEIEIVKNQPAEDTKNFLIPSDSEKRFFERINFPRTTLAFFGEDPGFIQPFLKQSNRWDVLAAEDGIVRFTGDIQNFGKAVVVDHGQNLFSICVFLKEILAKDGDAVPAGFLLGRGEIDKPKIGIFLQGIWVDPKTFLKEGASK